MRWIWWHMPEFPALGRPRHEDCYAFEASLNNIARACLNNSKKWKTSVNNNNFYTIRISIAHQFYKVRKQISRIAVC